MAPPGIRRTLLGLEGVTAIGALGAGVLMVADPNSSVTMGDAILADLGYRSWRTVGLFLIAINGLFPLLVVVAALRRHRLAGLGHLGFGLALVVWIVVQVLRIGVNSALQPIFLVVGLLSVVLSWRGYRGEILAGLRPVAQPGIG
jgi:hypothetical protein